MAGDAVSPNSKLSELVAQLLQESFSEVTEKLIARLQYPDGSTGSPEKPATEVHKPKFDVPYSRNENFIGRDASLGQLFGLWRPDHQGRIAVVGLGGIGKTALAVEFVHRVREVSPATSIVFFTPEDLLSPNSHPQGSPLDKWLILNHDSSGLLVVDPGDEFEILLESMPGGDCLIDKLRRFNGSIILLARTTQDGGLLANPRNICALHGLEEEASINLLRESLGAQLYGKATGNQLREAVSFLSYVPRAILQVASLINNAGIQLAQFLDLYDKGDQFKLRLFKRQEPGLKIDEKVSITCKGVFDVKKFRRRYKGATKVLYQLYYLGGTTIPGSLLPFYDQLDLLIAMGVLKGHFLITDKAGDGTCTVHPLVFLAIKKILEGGRTGETPEVEEEQTWFTEILGEFSKQYPDPTCEDREWWRRCLAQLLIGSDLESNSTRDAVATIHHKESTYFSRKGLFSEALKEASNAKELLPDPLLHDHLGILENHMSLLEVLAKYQDVKKAIEVYPENVNPTNGLWKKRIIARLCLAEGTDKFNAAVNSFSDIRTARESAMDPTPDICLSTIDYGMSLMLKGEYKKAEVECRKALKSATELGEEHEYTLTSAHTLAEILSKDGKIDAAVPYIQEAIRGRETILGPDHPATLRSNMVKADLLLSKAVTLLEFKEVGDLLSDCLNVLSTKLPDKHPVVLTCKSNLALVKLAQGKYVESKKLNKAVLADRENGPWTEPTTHPDTLTSRHQLAEVLRVNHGCDAADEMSKSVYDERTLKLTNGTKTGSDFHPDQLSSMHHRAIVLSLLSKHTEALELIDLAVKGRKAVLGPDHPDVYLSMTWHGEILRSSLSKSSSQKTDRLNTIDELQKHALDGLTKIYDPEHQNILQCKTHMAFAKHERGGASGNKEAKTLYETCFQANQRNLGELHPETLKSKTRLARAIRILDSSKHEDAKRLWREACAGFAKALGVNAYCTVTAYKDYEDFFIKTYPTP